MDDLSSFAFPTDIRFGPGARHLAGDALLDAGARRPLVVTDAGVAELDLFRELVEGLAAAGLAPHVFAGVAGNPVASQVSAGAAAFDDHGADAIVTVGGGAAMDVAKAVGLLATNPGDLFDYEDGRDDARAVEHALPFTVAVPTTAGTGSEVGRSAVIADDVTRVKKVIFAPELLPPLVLADPELTVDLPAGLTAATGMDAITHNVEAYLAAGFHPICDGIALEGVRQGAAHLARAVAEPTDLGARGGMLLCSMMGAIAFQKGLGVVHSCAHALSAATDLHHGLANAVMIDHALAHNVEEVPRRFSLLAHAADTGDDTPEGFLAWLADLKAEIGMPRSLVDLGIERELQPRLVDLAFADACHLGNPRPVTADDLDAIFTAAFT